MDISLKLEGRSGCPIKIIDNGINIVVNKASSSLDYNDRLIKQAIKQNTFNSWYSDFENITSPHVYKMGFTTSGIAFFEMEYAKGEKFSDYLPVLTVKEIDNLANKFINYFNFGMAKANHIYVSNDIIFSKVLEIKTKVMPMSHYSITLKDRLFDFLENNKPTGLLPQEFCHGDFTFSNMLFKEGGQIYVFDFLDSFIESPIIDLVKLRQDTCFFWSIEIDEKLENYKVLKSTQILKYIDNKIEIYLKSLNSDFQDWYTYLEVLNLTRIMPYAHKAGDINFLNRNITLLLNKI